MFNVIAHLLLIFSLAASGYLILRRKKAGLIIYFCQLPLRVYFFNFTFGLIMDFIPLYDVKNGQQIMFIVLLVLELLRFVYSVDNYKNYKPINQNVIENELLDN